MRVCTTLIGILFWMSVFSQSLVWHKIDMELTKAYMELAHADPQIRYDSLAPLFERKLSKELTRSESFNYSFDSLSKHVTIRKSKDNKIKFYSWDDLCGGTWHSINSLVQFISENNKVFLQQLKTDVMKDGGYSDCSIYEVNEIVINKEKYYLTFGWGTHGEGMQFDIIRGFKISGNKLASCKCFIGGKRELVLEYPRSDLLNLRFNPILNEISYDEFNDGNEFVRHERTGRTIVLKISNGLFIKK